MKEEITPNDSTGRTYVNVSNSNGGGRHKTFEQKISAMKNASFFDIKPKSPPKLPNPVKKLPKERKFKEEKLKKEKKSKDEKIKREPSIKLPKPAKEKIVKTLNAKPVPKEKPTKKALTEEAIVA